MASPAPTMQAGIAALRSGDAAGARATFEALAAGGRADAALCLYLAHSCLVLGDAMAADAALDRVLAQQPRNLAALCLKGDTAARRGDDRAAASFYGFALGSAPAGGGDAETVRMLRAAEAGLAAAQGRFRASLDATLGLDEATPARFREAMAILSGEAPVQLQQPTSFYYPGLAATPFFDPADLPWTRTLTEAAPAIRAELDALLADEAGFAPYVRAEPGRPSRGHALLDDPRWSALHLWQGGEPVAANAARCPATMAALAAAPIPRIRGRSPMALFSMLRPRTHIPPHTGLLNTRLICHLPLIVPEGCRLRVGNETRAVEPFRPMIFDDSIEHEAWNDGNAVRIVLLFEIWRPDLREAERALLTRMFEAVVDYDARN